MAFNYESDTDRMASINMTPLIDVMLVLLIIFMVTAPMLTTGINVHLPESKTGHNLQSDGLVVKLLSNGLIEIEDHTFQEDSFIDQLRVLGNGNNKQPIIIQADSTLAYGHVVHVVDLIREAGFAHVGLATQAVLVKK